MYAVGVGKIGEQLDEAELINIAGDRERVLTADNYAKLNLIKESLTEITCHGSQCTFVFILSMHKAMW